MFSYGIVGHTDSDVNKWLTSSETIVYDTKSHDLKVGTEGGYRGVVTNKRTIFITENKIDEISHNLITSITWERKILKELRALGIILLVVGLIVYYYSSDYGLPNMDSYMKYSSYALMSAGVVSIIIFVFQRPETLVIFGAGRSMVVGGQRKTLEKTMQEIRNQRALYEDRTETSGEIPKSVEEAIRLLKLRLAKGDITEDEYLKLKNTIEK